METKYTKEDIVLFTINILNGINIPASMTEQIGIPLYRALTNLKVLKQMMNKEEEKEEEKDEQADG